MKKALLILPILPLLLILSFISHSQAFQDITVNNGPNWWQTLPAIISLPDEYNDSVSKKYPLIIFLPGSGEGSSTRNDALLESQGLPYKIVNGQVPKAVIGGVTTKFIVVCIQPSAGETIGMYARSDVWNYVLNSITGAYRVDMRRITLTGLSIGAGGAHDGAVWNPLFAQKIAGCWIVAFTGVLNQPPDFDSTASMGKLYRVKLHAIYGSADSAGTSTNAAYNSIAIVNKYNSTSPSPLAAITRIAGAAHNSSQWNPAYDTAFRDNAVGKNIYEWAAGNFSTPPPDPNLSETPGSRIPITTEYVYQDNSQQDRADRLIDGDTLRNYIPAGPKIYKQHEVVFDTRSWNVTKLYAVKVWIAANDTCTVNVIAVRQDNGAEINLGTFSGGANQHFVYRNTDTTIAISKVILRTSSSNYELGSEVELWGNYTVPAVPARKVRRPLGWLAGMDGHSYDFMNTAKMNVIKSIGSTLGGYRVWENAYDVVDSAGSFRFEPELGNSPRYPTDSVFKQLKAWSPNAYTWKVVTGQFTDQLRSWDVIDNFPNRYFKGVDSVYLDRGNWGEIWLKISQVSQPTESFIPNWFVYKNGSLINKTQTPETFSTSLLGQNRHYNVGGGLSIVPGDTLVFYKSQASVNPIFWTDNSLQRRNTDSAHLRTGKAAFVYASRYGKNANVPNYPVQPGQRMLKGTAWGNATEMANEPNAWWTSFDGFWNGKTIFYHQNMVYDGFKKSFANTGAKQADSTIEVSIPGMASDKIDQVIAMIEEARKVRGYLPDGTIDIPFNVINIHIYSSPAGQYAGGTNGGLPPEQGMMPQLKMFVSMIERLAPKCQLFVSEWGWDQNKNSPLHAGMFGSYDREAVGGFWMVRGMLMMGALGVDRATYYTVAQGAEADTSNGGQFSTMRLIRQPVDADENYIVRSRQGDYMAQYNDALKNYTYSDSIATGIVGVHAYKYTYNDTTKIALWSEERSTLADTTSFIERTGTVTLSIPAGNYKLRQFRDDGSAVMSSTTATSTGAVVFNYAAKPVVIESYASAGGGGSPLQRIKIIRGSRIRVKRA